MTGSWRPSTRRPATSRAFGRIVRLCIATAQRRGEIAALKWSYIDQRTRAHPVSGIRGQERPRPHPAVPSLRRHAPPMSWYVRLCLPGARQRRPAVQRLEQERRPSSRRWSDSKTGACTICADRRPPAWRASASSRTSSSAYSIMRPQGMTAVYQRHHYVDEMRSALERWNRHIERLVATRLTDPEREMRTSIQRRTSSSTQPTRPGPSRTRRGNRPAFSSRSMCAGE